ncbi:TOBE domain-containing protein [Halococcus thailandensis]|uniref:ModE family transcriptional regulator n=1 Tax=Halococcus thailandensis JCM 13552 TaxID=1227457 RepID=M0N2D6_9EURY|nr:TOBE domain-containing protein [Halococcus thailandensis]EMA52097.1 ModE family transcriptional regulator [Halococcus thailandensis JCM 13552]
MDLEAGFDAQLDKSGVGFDERDAGLLRAIDDHGSLNAAAGALGRSYSRSQRRVVELEEAFGPLVVRERGGSGGGGSTLTDGARDLLAAFERLTAEFTGVAEVEETVLDGTVVERDGELATVETPAGTVRAIVPTGSRRVRLAIRADAVTLHTPGALPDRETSARNRYRGTVSTIESGDALARVALDIGDDTRLTALVTRESIATLALSPGDEAVASFKATATRAIPAQRDATDERTDD